MVMDKKEQDNVEVGFESHPPIEQDQDGIARLLRQSLLHFVDCTDLARRIVDLKDITQVIAMEEPDEENTDEDDEPDNDIYGVTSLLSLCDHDHKDSGSIRQIIQFLKSNCAQFEKLFDDKGDSFKPYLLISERYVNLPPQLALETFKSMSDSLNKLDCTHLVFISKILVRSKMQETKSTNKKVKSSANEITDPLVFLNPEEEIIFENADFHKDMDVSGHCEDNAAWSFSGNVKYVPHRRLMAIDHKKWPSIITNIEKELNIK